MLIYRRKWLIPCDFLVMCYCNESIPGCIVVMHHHRDALWCIITVMHHRYDVSTWCIKSVIREWLYVTFYCYDIDACMMCWDTVGWMLMHEWMMSVDAWMLMNEWWVLMNEWWMLMDERIWVLMHVDECEMYVEWCIDAFMMHWCMLNSLVCQMYVYLL